MPGFTQIWQRARTAISKLLFCCRVAASANDLKRLLINTKRFNWARTKPVIYKDPPIAYHVKIPHCYTIYLRTYAGDIQIFYDIFWRTIYQLPTSLLLKAKTVVDLGGHVGMATVFFNIHCPQATVYCVEADESNYALLVKNTEPGIDNGTIQATHAAISNKNDIVYLQKSDRSYNSQLADSITSFPVNGLRMEQFIREKHITHIDIIKIDIEGAESFLFKDDTAWLAITDIIIVEVHSAENLQLFTSAVTRHGFRIEKREFEFESLYVALKS